MRRYSDRPAPAKTEPQQPEGVITQVRTYEVITPLFGGGAEAGEADPVTIIRGTEIRGQLRFWWRATRGGNYNNIQEMKQAEDAIWGKAYKKNEKPAKQNTTVPIIVESINQGTPLIPFPLERTKEGSLLRDRRDRAKVRPDRSIQVPLYAAFPLQPTQQQLTSEAPPERKVYAHISFTVKISFPKEHAQEIESALWAWETFGGVGARTRRGFGALSLKSIGDKSNKDLPHPQHVKEWINDKFTTFEIRGAAPQNCPSINKSAIQVTRSYRSASLAWERLIALLRNFRQGSNDRRNIWPDTTAIRELANQRDLSRVRPNRYTFAKGVFGLPIIFHPTNTNSEDFTLQGIGEDKDRLASPLVLRPLVCQNNQVVGIALLLDEQLPFPEKLKLSRKDRQGSAKDISVNTQLTSQQAQGIDVLSKYVEAGNNNIDVLQTFMKYFGEETK